MATPILVFDGDCGFCSTSARFIERRIPTRAEVTPYQRLDLTALGTTRKRAEHEVLWVDEQGRITGGAQAVARLLTDAGGAWRLIGAVLRVPPMSWLTHVVYRLVSRNRHRLPGCTPACRLPQAS